jgi:cytochrome c oxidase subunit 1
LHTIVSLPDQSTATMPKRNYINNEHGLLSWLLTGDHKRIAMLYLISITFFFFIGGAFAGLIRLELLTPQPTWWRRIRTTSSSPCTASS